MNLLITSSDPLMFRDAKPFGDFGMFSGGLHRWPMPGTVAGALRTRLGFSRDPDYFEKRNPAYAENVKRILAEPLRWMLPVVREKSGGAWRHVYPRPADAFIYAHEASGVSVKKPRFARLGTDGEGSDLGWTDWLYPIAETRDKPPRNVPGFWRDDVMRKWWTNSAIGTQSAQELGFPEPPLEIRMHVAIDPETFTAQEGKLFASGGIRLECKNGGDMVEYGILCAFGAPQDTRQMTGMLHLGGERRTASVEEAALSAPEAPPIPPKTRFLRLQLLTPGNFGGWAPQCLLPSEAGSPLPWAKPEDDFPCPLRLRSAFTGSWTPVSGWDYERHLPKAMRKLVPSGSVYVVELQDPEKAQEVRDALWLRSLCPKGSQEMRDGYGVVAVAACDYIEN